MTRISTAMIYQRSLSAMLTQQGKVSETQLQLSSGKRVLTPSDDPASAARVLRLNGSIAQLQQYQSNAEQVKSRLENEEGVLDGAVNVLQRANELAVQGNNGSLTQSDKQGIAQEVRQLLDQILSQANSRGPNGEYIFAGYQTSTQPFSNPSDGNYNYNGDLGGRKLQISADRQIADGDNGFDLFMDVPTEPATVINGAAATAFPALAAGDVTLDGGNGNGVVALAAIPAASSAAERASQLSNAINAETSRTSVRAAVGAGGTLQLTGIGGSGITLVSAGSTPPAADPATGLVSGTTAASTASRDIFSTLYQLATELEANRPVDRYIGDIQFALENISNTRSTIGSRLNSIDTQQEINDDSALILKGQKSNEEDLDYTEAITRFERQQVALEAAQKSYVQIQRLSLFSYM